MIASSPLPKRAPGSLVESRGRMWIVLPGSSPEIIRARPLGSSESEATSLFPFMEDVGDAKASWPGPENLGRIASTRLLFHSARLATRSGAGPYRSLGKIAVEPRPYQLVPLMMALRSRIPRLFIADDVGVGKTVEACLIAKELLERGEANGLAVLCPPHLCEQWRGELLSGFNIDAFILDADSAARAERSLPPGKSVFDVKRHFIVSLDFIKSDNKRSLFAGKCPNLVIVDEAHSCANLAKNSSKQQRHKLLKELASDPERALLLLSATPHSGNEGAFLSLVSLLGDELSDIEIQTPERRESADIRDLLASRFIQRRRVDIQNEGEHFPDREIREFRYDLSPEYKELLDRTKAYARELIERFSANGSKTRRRIGEWTAIALLRCVASSPQAALSALENRLGALREKFPDLSGKTAATPSNESEIKALLSDLACEGGESEEESATEAIPASAIRSFSGGSAELQKEADELERLVALARALESDESLDLKLKALEKLLKKDLGPEKRFDGEPYSPVVFCRYIGTAQYVAERLRSMGYHAAAISGEMSPHERAEALEALHEKPRRVLVATDCLSEGMNLQFGFDAVVHYDLAWNPVRHEQREGRVDRLKQERPVVRACSLVANNSFVDQAVLGVIISKIDKIRKELGILVPAPRSDEQVNEALIAQMGLIDDIGFEAAVAAIESDWANAREGEKKNRAKYAQHAIKPGIARAEWEKCYSKLGDAQETREFVRTAYKALIPNSSPQPIERGGALLLNADLSLLPQEAPELSHRLKRLGLEKASKLDFSGASAGRVFISRSHPLVDMLAERLRESAFEGKAESNEACSRACAIVTDAVESVTVVAAVRSNYRLSEKRGENGLERELVCEETFLVGRRANRFGEHLSPIETAQGILPEQDSLRLAEESKPVANISLADQAAWLQSLLNARGAWGNIFEAEAKSRGETLKKDHIEARKAAGDTGTREVKWIDPAEPLAVFIFIPPEKQPSPPRDKSSFS